MFLPLLLSTVLQFGSPVNYQMTLAGNFGEPRPNHFHGGIDVRTDRVEGKPIFSVADGYVSRITVGLDGFGNAVYVRHPGGITTVYCHLKKFVPQLAAMVRKWQYQNETCVADVRLRPTDFPVARGQFIAVSGNSGASLAPHLHLEFRNTRTQSFIDPLRFLKDFITDTTPPIAHAFKAYPVEGEGVFCGSTRRQSYGFTSLHLQRVFTAWGKVGFGLWANDYMEGSFGILGVYRTTLTVDGEVVFESVVDSIPARCNRMVNSWGDYSHWLHTRRWYMKSFADPGNSLPVLRYSDGNRGVVAFTEERDYHVVYTVADVFGNRRDYSFTVRGQRQNIPQPSVRRSSNVLRHSRMTVFQRPGVLLVLPPMALPCDVELSPRAVRRDSSLSVVWSFSGSPFPLLTWGKLSLKLDKPVSDPSKLYIKSTNGGRYMGGEYHDGWVTARVRELGGEYEIAQDDVPPVIEGFVRQADRLRFVAYDKESGLRSVKGYVDGRFVLFERQDRSNVYVCRLADTPVGSKGTINEIKIVAVDNRGNETVVIGHAKLK